MANIREVERLKGALLELGRHRPLRDPLSSGAELEMAGPKLHAVVWLGNDGPLTMGELAQRLGVTEKGVTGLADRLEESGYCRRERDTEDRRVVRLRLTGQGEQFFTSVAARLDKKLGFLLDVLAGPDRDALFRIITRLSGQFAALSAALPSNVTPLSTPEPGALKHSHRRKR